MAGGPLFACRHRSTGVLTAGVVYRVGVYPGRVHPGCRTSVLRTSVLSDTDLGLGPPVLGLNQTVNEALPPVVKSQITSK